MTGPSHAIQSWIKAIGRLLVLIALLAVLQESVRLYLTAQLKAQLQAPLPEGYVLDFQHSRLNWRQQALQIRRLSLKPEAGLPLHSSQIELFLPHIRLDLRSIFSSLRSGRLIVDDILIEAPRIVLAQSETRQSNFTQSALSVLSDLSQYLSSLQIQKLEVKKAQLSHTQWRDSIAQNLHFSEINLSMSEFSVDSSLRRHSFLNANEVELEILGQRLLLPQKDHELSFDTLRLSTHDREIYFKGLRLQPMGAEATTQDQITINSPEVSLENIDFQSSYLNQTLDIGRLRFQAPSIGFVQHKLSDSTEYDLQVVKDAITQLTERIQIETIEIKEADIDMDLAESNTQEIRFDLDSIFIHRFLADTSTSFSNIDHLPFQNIELYLSNIQQDLNAQIGSLNIRSAQLDSRHQEMIVEGLEIGDPALVEQRFYQQIPHIQFDGIDIFDVLLGRQARVQQISCFRPYTHIRSDQESAQATPDRNFYLVLTTFFQDFFLKEISTQQLLLREGQLHIEDKLKIQEYDYQGKSIQLNAQAASWSRIVPSFSCQARNYFFQMQGQNIIRGDSLFITGEKAQVYGLSINRQDSLRKLGLRSSVIELQGLKIDSLFAGQVYADSLKINDPLIDLVQEQKRQSNTLSLPVHIPLVILNHGKLAYQAKNIHSLKIKDFDGVLAIQDSITLRYSRFEELHFLPDQGTHHFAVAKGQQFDNRFSYAFEEVRIIPKRDSSRQDSSLIIPNLRVFNWDQMAWENEGLFKFEKLIIDRPQAFITLPDSTLFQTGTGRSVPIQLDTLLLFNAGLALQNQKDQTDWRIPSLTLALYALDLRKNESFSNAVSSLLLGLDQGIQLTHPDFELRTAPVFYNSTQKNIQTNLIEYQGKRGHGLTQASLRQLKLTGFDPAQLKVQNQWQLPSLSIDSVDLHFQKDTSGHAPSLSPKDWPLINIEQLNVGNIDAQLELRPLVQVKNASLAGTKIVLDSNWQNGNLDQAWQTLATSAKTIRFSPDAEQHYELLFGLDYHSGDQVLQLTSPELRRNLSPEAFAQQLDYRTDYWQVKAEALIVPHFHPGQLFQEQLHFPKLSLRQLIAHDFNDERIPLPAQYKPMLPDQIKDTPIPFLIDTLDMTGAITYSSIAPLTGDSSWISFNAIQGRIFHLTNIPAHFSKELRLMASARLYDQAPLEVDMQFQLNRSPSTFELSGTLQDLDMQILNPILRGQTALSVSKGYSSRLLFNMAANDSVAVGELLFRYKNLRIQLLDKEDLSNRSSFLSFWTNRLIQSRNPNWLRRRKGIIYFERDQQKAISHYWAHSILSGIVSSIGVKNTRRRLRKANLDIDDFSYETLLKEQLKRPKEGKRQK